MQHRSASFAVLTILFIGCLIIACGFMGFVQAKKVDSYSSVHLLGVEHD